MSHDDFPEGPLTTIHTDDGVELSYRVVGDGPTNLIFWLSWGMSAAEFDHDTEMMDLKELRFILYDPRGTANSDKPRDRLPRFELAQTMLSEIRPIPRAPTRASLFDLLPTDPSNSHDGSRGMATDWQVALV